MIARTTALALILAAAGVGSAAPASAQPRQRDVEVFGADRCPEGSDNEIVVCHKRPESDRYRIPTQFREAAPADRVTQEGRVNEMVALGRTGTDSCSPVGPGGFTGCFVQQAQQNRAIQKQNRRSRSTEPR